jgi:hypothetical protein
MNTLLWAGKLYAVPDAAAQQNSNQQFIRRAKSFRMKRGERNEQMISE